jgi:hypothetical protein
MFGTMALIQHLVPVGQQLKSEPPGICGARDVPQKQLKTGAQAESRITSKNHNYNNRSHAACGRAVSIYPAAGDYLNTGRESSIHGRGGISHR